MSSSAKRTAPSLTARHPKRDAPFAAGLGLMSIGARTKHRRFHGCSTSRGCVSGRPNIVTTEHGRLDRNLVDSLAMARMLHGLARPLIEGSRSRPRLVKARRPEGGGKHSARGSVVSPDSELEKSSIRLPHSSVRTWLCAAGFTARCPEYLVWTFAYGVCPRHGSEP